MSSDDQDLVTGYVRDVDGWDEWQCEYRYGVLLIFPPEPLRTQVNEMRARFDPKSQAICDAHITLTVPLPRPLSQDDLTDLRSVAEEIPSITVCYGPLSNYLPHPGVVLAIEPHDRLDHLRAALESTAAFEGASARSHPFSAHMTIAEFITVERTLELMDVLRDEAPTGTFRCDRVTLAVPDATFHLDSRAVLHLGS